MALETAVNSQITDLVTPGKTKRPEEGFREGERRSVPGLPQALATGGRETEGTSRSKKRSSRNSLPAAGTLTGNGHES